MNVMLNVFLIIIGVAILALSSNWSIIYLKKVAKSLNVHDIIIGLTITSVGTSLPEIFTNVSAALAGNNGALGASNIAIGNIIGSCASQITIIVGIVALYGTLKPKDRTITRDGSIMVLAAVIMYGVSLTGRVVSQIEGLIMVCLYIGYIIWIIKAEKKLKSEIKHTGKWSTTLLNIVISLVFIGIVVLSARVVLDNSLDVAQALGVSSLIIGLMIGLGTSLPELAISISAIKSRNIGISVGDLIGSNITDPLLSLGIGAMVAKNGFAVDSTALWFDFPFWIVSAILTLLIFHQYKTMRKGFAIMLIIIYITYMVAHFFL